MLDWHSCQICHPLELKILLLILLSQNARYFERRIPKEGLKLNIEF